MNPITFGGKRLGSARDTTFPSDIYVHGIRRIIGQVLQVNVNQTNTDIYVPLLLNPGANAVFREIHINNASVSLTTATFGVFTAAAAGGTALVAAGTAMSTLTTSNLTLITAAATTTFIVNQTTQFSTSVTPNGSYLYFRVGTAQGAAATADIYLWGDVYP